MLRTLFPKWLAPQAPRPACTARALRRAVPLRLETLEDRTTPSAVFWDGGGDGVNWTNALNWSNDILPGAADDVTINTGTNATIQMNGGFNSIHSLQSANALTFSGGTLTVSGTASVTKTVTLSSFSIATLTLNGASDFQNLTENGGTINGTGSLTIGGTWTWSNSGTMSGTGHTVLNGTATLSGGSGSRLDGRTVDNFGAASVGLGSALTFANNAVWNNQVGGVFVLPDSAAVLNQGAGPAAAFNNFGTVQKTGPIGTAAINVPFNNTGTTQVQVGTLTLVGGTGSGTFDVASGALLNLGGARTFQAGTAVTGVGTTQVVSGGTVTVTGSVTANNFSTNGGTLTANAPLAVNNFTANGPVNGTGAVTVNGTFTWANGIISGTGALNLNGTSNMMGGFQSQLNGKTVNNAGTATVAIGNSITFGANAVWNNLAGGVFQLPDSSRIDVFGPPTGVFNNAGALRKITPGGLASIAVPVNNSGLVDIQTGSISVQSLTQTGGSTVIAAGVDFLASAGGVQILGGELTGSGRVVGAVTNSGTVRPGIGGIGTLTFASSYTQTAAGRLEIELGGTTPGTSYDRLAVGTTANLGGTLAVSTIGGFLPNFGDFFDVVTFGTSTGDFATYTGLNLGNYHVLTPDHEPTFLRLLTVSSNQPPVIDPIGNQSVDEGATLTLTVTAHGPEPTETLTYSLDAAPAGASIDPPTGVFTYTPDDGPASYDVTVRVTDNGLPALSTIQTFTITVNNVAPAAAINGAQVQSPEGSEIALTSTVSDPSTADTTAGFTYAWTVTKNGDPYAIGSTADFNFTPDDNGAYNISLTVTDKDGGVGISTASVAVTNVAPTAAISGAPSSSPEGSAIGLLSTITDPSAADTAEGFTYSWSVTKNGDAFAAGGNPDFSFTPDDNGTYVVTLTATDKDGGTGIATATITATNLAPTAAINGAPSSSPEGSAISLTSTVTDPSTVDTAAGFTYVWSVTKNGNPFAAGNTADFSFTPDDNGTFVVTLSATDKDGDTGTASATISVTNVAPTAAVNGPASGVRGQTRTFTFTAADVSSVDQAAGFTFSVDWGDGNVQTVSGPSGLSVDHIYSASGTYTVQVTATDKDGGSGTAQNFITIAAVEMQGDTLVVGGTNADDVILVLPAQGTTVLLNGQHYGGFSGVQRVIVFGQDGDDVLHVAGGNGIVSELYGGAGNDVLLCGGGTSILDGGSGNDLVQGGSGRNIVIGGTGSDIMDGSGGDDLLIAGDFEPSARFDARRADLLTALSEWTSSDPYLTRVAVLTPLLTAGATDDGVTDVLLGSGGHDWFLARTTGPNADLIARQSGEVVTELP